MIKRSAALLIVKVLCAIAQIAAVIPAFASAAAGAPRTCEGLFGAKPPRENPRQKRALEKAKAAAEARKAKLDEIEQRLMRRYPDWGTDELLNDLSVAKDTMRAFRRFGSARDLEIFDTFVAIHEATEGYWGLWERGFYYDRLMGHRPKSHHFLERHWSWRIVGMYFFNSPSTLNITKDADLAYLKHVLETARSGPKAKLPDVLKRANHTWSLRGLERFPRVRARYLEYASKADYRTHFRAYAAKVRGWINAAETPEEKTRRTKIARHNVKAFVDSQTTLDLFLVDKYFELFLKLKPSIKSPNYWTQMTNWDVFEMGLDTGSIQYVTDFVFANSHDVETKGYLGLILDQMEKLVTEAEAKGKNLKRLTFDKMFNRARDMVDTLTPNLPAPEEQQAQLHIFAPSGGISTNWKEKHGAGRKHPVIDPMVTETIVTWNEKLGKLRSTVVSSKLVEEGQMPKVITNWDLVRYLNQYFEIMVARGSLTAEQALAKFEEELNSPLQRTTYLVFTDPKTGKLLAMARIYDGSRLEYWNLKQHQEINEIGTATPVEKAGIKVPEREEGKAVRELGRLFVSSEVTANSLGTMMERIAEYLHNTGADGVVYFDAAKSAMALYERNGATIVFTPEDLPSKEGHNALYVGKTSVPEIVGHYFPETYTTVKKRKAGEKAQP